ncbi:SH3 domain-containing protein [Streptomyces inhibens]|uniref:SH3 domain-containing protein n=1 Tax=Streptomyces inhibens TaxID=2293571 RepID=UPI0036C06C3C
MADLTLRAKPTTKAAALGVVPKGQRIYVGDGAAGETYTACGKRWHIWYQAESKYGTRGWVAATCLKQF